MPSLNDIVAAAAPSGALVACGGGELERKPMAAVRALAESGASDLRLATMLGSADVEVLLGSGAVTEVHSAGVALTGLAQALVVKVASATAGHAREELALALSIVLLGFLMMIVRRNAVTQVVGFMSMENGLILAATGARGMPLVVEVSVAFSVLISLFVFAVFVFRIRERFDTIDIEALDRMRGDRR